MPVSIGSVSCTFVHGYIAASRELSETWHVNGINGWGVMLLGIGDGDFSLEATYYNTSAAVDTWLSSMQNLQGTIVSITNDFGQTVTQRFVERVEPSKEPAVIPGTSYTHRGVCRVTGKAV
jgi:hypothetical protein